MGSVASVLIKKSDKNAEKKSSSASRIVVLAGEKENVREVDTKTSSKVVDGYAVLVSDLESAATMAVDVDNAEDIWAAMSGEFLSSERSDHSCVSFLLFCIC
jgi:hypothetical protein